MTGLAAALQHGSQKALERSRQLDLPDLQNTCMVADDRPNLLCMVRRPELDLPCPVLAESRPTLHCMVEPPTLNLLCPVLNEERPLLCMVANQTPQEPPQAEEASLQVSKRKLTGLVGSRPTGNCRPQIVRAMAMSNPRPVSRELPITPIYQGNTNGCGTTSLAMSLNSTQRVAGFNPVRNFTRQSLDAGNRELNGFSAPHMLARVARDNGFFAALQNNADFNEIRNHLNNGRVMLALIQSGPGLHYVVIHGYEDGRNDNERRLIITDPARQTGTRQAIRYSDFQRDWSNLHVGSNGNTIDTGINRMIIPISSRDELGGDRGVTTQMLAALTVNEGTNACRHLTQPGGNPLIGLYNLGNAAVGLLDTTLNFSNPGSAGGLYNLLNR